MTSHVSGVGASNQRAVRTGAGSGWLLFASALMIFGGLMMALEGIAALSDDDVFVSTRNYVFEFDLTGWGWIHLILGIVITLAGFALTQGATWARIVGGSLAGLAMLANFVWLPYAPVWAIILIAMNGFVIWALCTAPSPSKP